MGRTQLHIKKTSIVRTKVWILLFITSLAFGACVDDEVKIPDLGKEYFPISVGDWSEYKIDSIVYNDFTQSIDTYQFYVREEINALEIDKFGDSSYLMYGYFKVDTGEWQPYKSLKIDVHSNSIDRLEENRRTTILVFPISIDQFWFGNGQSSFYPKWLFSYERFGAFVDVPGKGFTKSVTVKQDSTKNLIQNIYSIEKYAENVGLTYKIYRDIENQNGILSGQVRTQVLESYLRN